MSTRSVDFIVVGAGIAGISAAYDLASRGTVAVLEQERHTAYHATGRSAAIFVDSYGGTELRALSAASRPFLESPDVPGAQGSVLKRRRGIVYVARSGEDALLADGARYDLQHLEPISVQDLIGLVPIIDQAAVSGALFERSASDIDVHGLHQIYTRGLVARRGQLHVNAQVTRIARSGDAWTVEAGAVSLQSRIVINAAGAWAAQIAALMGADDQRLVPYRRSAALLDVPSPLRADEWPMVVDAQETVYFKPDAGRLMLSPADETPAVPADAVAEDIDIAVAVDRFESLTTLDVKRVSHTWAGLRTLAPDRVPVIGFDPGVTGLFWLAGQGGAGVQTAPAAARLTAALVTGERLPDDLVAAGISPATYAPGRQAAQMPLTAC